MSSPVENQRNGYSLVEIMVVMTIIGVLTVISVPSYQRAVEGAKADAAAANLRAVWSAERLYWLDYHAYTSDLTKLRDLGLVDPEIIVAATGYTYTVRSAGSDTFRAAATCATNTLSTGEFTIDETGLIAGTVRTYGGAAFVSGY
jgi:prepilin-type N-terminal cleavage/methylation domain-containing protein